MTNINKHYAFLKWVWVFLIGLLVQNYKFMGWENNEYNAAEIAVPVDWYELRDVKIGNAEEALVYLQQTDA